MLPPDSTDQAIYAHVRRDLLPPASVVHGKIGVAVAAGGLTSLFLCGQFGIGLSNAASDVHGAIMSSFGMSGCSVICGILFAVVPVGILRAISSPLQFRFLMRHRLGVHALWTACFGLALALASGHVTLTRDLPLWLFAALAAIAVFERLVDRVSGLLASQRPGN